MIVIKVIVYLCIINGHKYIMIYTQVCWILNKSKTNMYKNIDFLDVKKNSTCNLAQKLCKKNAMLSISAMLLKQYTWCTHCEYLMEICEICTKYIVVVSILSSLHVWLIRTQTNRYRQRDLHKFFGC